VSDYLFGLGKYYSYVSEDSVIFEVEFSLDKIGGCVLH
jgi:hypothetical protein